MNTTDDLIGRLAGDLAPVSGNVVVRRLAIGAGAGALVSAAVMLVWLGPRADLAAAIGTSSFWAKFVYTLALGLIGLAAIERLSRPGVTPRRAAPAAAVTLAAVAVLALLELALSAPAERPALFFGTTAGVCPWRIVALSMPIFLGTVWAVRGLAPTRLTLAGLAAGLVAGGLGAWIYSFHCGETAMPFLATWYSAGIAAGGLIGAICGRWLLRW